MGNPLCHAVAFLVVALVAAFLGFGGVAGTAMEGARILLWVATVLFIISVVVGFIRRAQPLNSASLLLVDNRPDRNNRIRPFSFAGRKRRECT